MNFLFRKCFLIATVVFGLITSGCSANWNSVYEIDTLDPAKSTVISGDAKKRFVLSSFDDDEKIRRFCAEPSPDVFSVLGQAASGGATFGQTADPKTLNIALEGAFSSTETGTTIQRTQTINMLKEMMYRTCERFLNGQIDKLEYPIIAARDQRIMTSILAIEQLTGTIAPRLVVISSTSAASTVAAEGEETNSPADNAGSSTVTTEGALLSSEAMTQAQVEMEKERLKAVQKVASTVERIVELSFDDTSETQFFCYSVIRGKSDIDPHVQETCLAYLAAKVQVDAEQFLQEFEQAKKKRETAGQKRFGRFFSRVSNETGNGLNAGKLKELIDTELEKYPNKTFSRTLEKMKSQQKKSELLELFDTLPSVIQLNLARE